MILDQLSASAAYESLHPLFPKAFAYLRGFDVKTADGKYELHGQDLVAIVQRYQTAPSADKLWEAHQVYGDIQVVYQGLEHCGHTDQKTLVVTKPYIAEKDVEKYAAPTAPAAPSPSRRSATPCRVCSMTMSSALKAANGCGVSSSSRGSIMRAISTGSATTRSRSKAPVR